MNAPGPLTATRTEESVLALVRTERAAADAAEVRILQGALEWADLHPASCLDDAETYHCRGGLLGAMRDTGIALAGPGAPLVEAYASAELATALGLGGEAGKRLLGQALELAHRLPRLWARVQAGEVQAWRARRVADATITAGLSVEAAAHVDRHLTPVAHSARPWQLTRLVEDAIARFDPDAAEARRAAAAEERHVTVLTDQASLAGTVPVYAELDLPDALTLDAALTTGAAALADAGCEETLDVRRALALGDLARGETPLTYERLRRAEREVVLHVHLSHAALTGTDHTARVREAHGLVSTETIRTWCGSQDTQVRVVPVIDLEHHEPVDAYEPPDRMVDLVELRDPTCVFPFCTRVSRACDKDHITAHAEGGPTCACNLAPLCRFHHRVKTHDHRAAGWAYTPLEPGVYLWRTPLGLVFLRDHTGTRDVTSQHWPARYRPTRHLGPPLPTTRRD